MHKKITKDDYNELYGPMNAVALVDAMHYVGVEGKTELEPEEARMVRAKKKKMVTSSKKHDRQVSREAKWYT